MCSRDRGGYWWVRGGVEEVGDVFMEGDTYFNTLDDHIGLVEETLRQHVIILGVDLVVER